MAKQTPNEVTLIDESNFGPVEYRDGLISFDALAGSADVVAGGDLYSDERKALLVGIPFIITTIQFHPGVMRNKIRQNYVTLEAWTGDTDAYRRAGAKDIDVPMRSNIFINDGGTGIRRQTLAYLVSKGVVTLPSPIVEAGPIGKSSYDLPIDAWDNVSEAGILKTNTEHESTFTYHIPNYLSCPRGLRVSRYKNDDDSDSATYYLA